MIYFAQPKNGGPIRIGSTGNPTARAKTLGTFMPGGVEFVCEIEGGESGEFFLHQAFQPIRIELDWFRSCSAIWQFIIDVNTNGRPDWLPKDIIKAKELPQGIIEDMFGSMEHASEVLGYACVNNLRQAVVSSSSKAFRLPSRLAFWNCAREGLLPNYITDLHGGVPSLARNRAAPRQFRDHVTAQASA